MNLATVTELETPSSPPPLSLVPPPPELKLPVDLHALLRELEDSYIAAALAQTGGNRKAAADLLGLQRTTLVEKLRRRSQSSRRTE